MKSTEPFDGWPWALAPAVVEHIAARLEPDAIYEQAAERDEILACPWPRYSEDGEDGLICRWPRDHSGIVDPLRRAACVTLRTALAKGKVRAKDPIDAAIELEFWKFAEISEAGSAVNLSSGRKFDHFEVCAEDVLRIWPLTTPAGEPSAKGPPDQAEASPVAAAPASPPVAVKQNPVHQVAEALKTLYPDGKLPAKHKAVRERIGETVGYTFSESTLDRARKKAWP